MSRQKGQQVTKVLLQVGQDVETSAANRYQQQFQPTNKAKQKFLSSSFKTKPSCSSGRDVINSHTCSNTQSLAARLDGQ